MIGYKKKKSLFDAPMNMPMAMEKPEVRITYAENGFIVSCDFNDKYVAKSLDEALKFAKEHFEESLKEDEKNS